MTLKVNTTTNKLELVGKADGISFAHSMEFATTTKDDVLRYMRDAQEQKQAFNLVDIHGKFVGFNFEQIKIFSMKIVEIVEVYDAPADE